MEYFKINGEKHYTIYTEDNGRYYKQGHAFWNKGGYYVPQSRKRISKAEYERTKKIYEEGEN